MSNKPSTRSWFRPGSDLPAILDQYETWLGEHGLHEEPDALRRFAQEGYIPYFYDAHLQLLEAPKQLSAGEAGALGIRVQNRSPLPWSFTSGTDRGVSRR